MLRAVSRIAVVPTLLASLSWLAPAECRDVSLSDIFGARRSVYAATNVETEDVSVYTRAWPGLGCVVWPVSRSMEDKCESWTGSAGT